jgi:secreted PhoX family phosphatase
MNYGDVSIGYSDGDVDTNRSGNPTLASVVSERYSRRQALFGGVSAATVAVFGSSLLSACGDGDENAPPTVNAGQSVTTSSGKVVTLTATATDDSGPIQSGTWSQVSGPTVTLANAGAVTTTFLAPNVATSTPLVFRFTAKDTGGAEGTGDTTVTIEPAKLDFTPVAKNLNDVVTVPAGYTVTVLYRTGDPLLAGAGAYGNMGNDTNFAARAGDHHDGMSFFGLSASGSARDESNSSRGLLVLNHENINQQYLHPNGPTNPGGVRPEAEAIKEVESHGVSVVEISRANGTWAYVPGGALNRRITPLTPATFSGAAKGSALLKTLYSKDGTAGRGTINNCANGTTAWGTYLTNEENWAGYFRRDAADTALRSPKEVAALNRYGLSVRTGNFGWSTVRPADGSTSFARWNITLNPSAPADGTGDFRYEANQMGWVVEIDPYDPTVAPRKRTALGRMNHEGCTPGRMIAGMRPAFYMGDDAQNEYIYKFVSATPWAAGDASAANRIAIGDKYMDAGTLYVARFNADGSGTWLPLVFGQGSLTSSNATFPFVDQADVLVHTRLAADALGATKMDRPEWTAVSPKTGEMYCTLTNNTSRTTANTDAANPRAYTDPKVGGGQTNGNANGHIIRLRETGDSTEATSFTWDIYVFGAGADLNPANINLSGLDATNDFSSCDGLWFARPTSLAGQAPSPVMWIETDDGAYTDVTNCMLLAAMPGTVGDGTTRTITNTITPVTGAASTGTQSTRIGKAPGTNLRRFLVGPKECEITGIDSTPDGKTVFVNIQHPGENGSPAAPSSNWPNSQTGAAPGIRPRSATIAITKDDGGVVGL